MLGTQRVMPTSVALELLAEEKLQAWTKRCLHPNVLISQETLNLVLDVDLKSSAIGCVNITLDGSNPRV
jgi:hypothetical protein